MVHAVAIRPSVLRDVAAFDEKNKHKPALMSTGVREVISSRFPVLRHCQGEEVVAVLPLHSIWRALISSGIARAKKWFQYYRCTLYLEASPSAAIQLPL